MTQTRPTVRTTAIMFVAVFVGGAAGSLLREVFSAQIPGIPIVTATFGINVVACFILGWLYSVRHRVHAHVLHLGAVGFCGGLSTFSSFVAELERMAAAHFWGAISAAALEIAVGLAAAILGEAIGRQLHKQKSMK
ncbi:camphor resistance protein CrcB [Ruegeria denitrificans]|uniref:Fluoride-specific ion channel FluC n=1 Tax=Ruegeria denitrificans TaxID=1715692 RepID=A0A0P1I8U0_9RHOB|nr:CrcB family protein [Ruegeria denitrificans]CUJ98097.1 camphor resistance protein CrcB [Ruegeria denitrificans]